MQPWSTTQAQSTHLLPIPHFQYGFTTDPLIHAIPLTHVSLSDKVLGVYKVSSRTAHPLVSPPAESESQLTEDGSQPGFCTMSDLPPPELAWEAFYPKGSINPTAEIPGGFGFYLAGTKEFSNGLSDGATEVVMSYRIMLERDWEWVKGGKLPGVCAFKFPLSRNSF